MRYSSAELFLHAARVAVGSPDFCHRLLSQLGEELREEAVSTAEMVVYGTAIRRNDPLIDLAVAQYSPRPSHLHNCFMRTLARAPNTLQRSYQTGLRLACLQNQRRPSAEGGNPTSYLGRAGAAAFLKVATSDELFALFTNPAIDEHLVEALYRWNKPFSDLPPARWSSILVYCMDNPRLREYRGTTERADLAHDRIHKAIWAFVERAPFNDITAQIVLNTLMRLSPEQVYLPDSIEAALDRWSGAGLPRMGRTGHSLTGLSRQDELRCLMASLYGRKEGALSDAAESSSDIARRCCYYANAPLNLRQIRAGYARDAAAFLIAAVSNVGILLDTGRSALLEQYLGDDWMTHRYLRIREALHRARPSVSALPVTDRLRALLSSGRFDGYRVESRSAGAGYDDGSRIVEERESPVLKPAGRGKGPGLKVTALVAALAVLAALIWFRYW